MSASGEVEVQMTPTPWKLQTCSATRVVVTGSATSRPRLSEATRSSMHEQGALFADELTALVDQRDALADRVEAQPERRPRAGDQLAEAFQIAHPAGERLRRSRSGRAAR